MKRQLTVAQLIEGLQKAPPNALVSAEGCDCIGPAVGLDIDATGVTLRRKSGNASWDEPLWTPFGPCKHEPIGGKTGYCTDCDQFIYEDED